MKILYCTKAYTTQSLYALLIVEIHESLEQRVNIIQYITFHDKVLCTDYDIKKLFHNQI